MTAPPRLRVGIVAGTSPHTVGDLARELAGVDRILHAGDIGDAVTLERLAHVAPLTAIVSDRDYIEFGDRFPEIAELDLGGARVLLTHMAGTPPDVLPAIAERLADDPPDVVVYGQATAANVTWLGGTLFFSPGSASRGSAGHAPTCGILEIEGRGRITAVVLDLDCVPRQS